MRPDEVPHEYVMAAMKASGLLHHDTARPALAAVLPLHRAVVLREAAEIADQAGAVYAARGDNDRASAAFALMEQFKAMADAAAPTSKEPQR